MNKKGFNHLILGVVLDFFRFFGYFKFFSGFFWGVLGFFGVKNPSQDR